MHYEFLYQTTGKIKKVIESEKETTIILEVKKNKRTDLTQHVGQEFNIHIWKELKED